MTTTTTNLGLKLYNNTTDGAASFLTYRMDMSGNTGTSNMELIDAAFSNLGFDPVLHNVKIGLDALGVNTTGHNNVAVGESVLGTNTTGYNNTIVGNYSGSNAAVGSNNNIVIGYSSFQNGGGNNNIVIGNSTGNTVVGNYNLLIGEGASTSNPLIGGSMGDDYNFMLYKYPFVMFSGNNSRDDLSILGYNYEKPTLGIYNTDNPLVLNQNSVQAWYIGSGTGFGFYSIALEVNNLGNLKFYNKNIETSTSIGTKIGTDTTQKIGFWNTTPVVQPASANQGALTNSTGGTYDGTIQDVTASYSQTILNNNFTDIYTLLNEIRSALVAEGLIKGSA